MLKTVAGLVSGLLFGIGLTVAQMINPQKVLDFLDIGAIRAGGWDPSLALVLGGAVATTAAGYRLVFRRAAPLFAPSFSLPTRRDIDAKLIVGSAIFGLGWGLVGFCPGPALAAVGIGGLAGLVFVAAMLAGMAVHHLLFARQPTGEKTRSPSAATRL